MSRDRTKITKEEKRGTSSVSEKEKQTCFYEKRRRDLLKIGVRKTVTSNSRERLDCKRERDETRVCS